MEFTLLNFIAQVPGSDAIGLKPAFSSSFLKAYYDQVPSVRCQSQIYVGVGTDFSFLLKYLFHFFHEVWLSSINGNEVRHK